MIWLAAQANPTHAAAQPVASGRVDWGVLASWREYVYKSSARLGRRDHGRRGGHRHRHADRTGAYFSFPVAGGSFEKGLYGAGDKLNLKTQGSVKFEKPGHCIIEVGFTDIDLTLGTDSTLVARPRVRHRQIRRQDLRQPAAGRAPNTPFATLGAVAPTYSANGKTVAWSALPATLTAAAATPLRRRTKRAKPSTRSRSRWASASDRSSCQPSPVSRRRRLGCRRRRGSAPRRRLRRRRHDDPEAGRPGGEALREQGVRIGALKPARGGQRRVVLPVAAGLAGATTTLLRQRGAISLRPPAARRCAWAS